MVMKDMQMLDKYTRQGTQQHTHALETAFQSTLSKADPMESMNINVGYLLSLIRLIDEYTISEINVNQYDSVSTYLTQLYRIIRSMFRLLYCKMNKEKIAGFKTRMTKAAQDITKVTTGVEGDYVDNNKAVEVEEYIGEIFQDLISDMETRGMLTYKKEDPMQAMGKFSD